MFDRAEKFINHLANLPTIPQNMNYNSVNYTKSKYIKTLLVIKTNLFQSTLHRDLSRKETGYPIP